MDATERDLARVLPLVLVLFCASGGAALIYEIVWYQLLQIAIGSTAISLGVLLATFMGGLVHRQPCAAARCQPVRCAAAASAARHLRAIEALIAVCGAAELLLIPAGGRAFAAGPQAGFAGMMLRSLVVRGVPASADLPDGRLASGIGALGGRTPRGALIGDCFMRANTVGAVAGCLVAGFYLLRLFDVNIASYAAMALNICGGSTELCAGTSHRHATSRQIPDHRDSCPQTTFPTCGRSALTIALSGMAALGAEVVWTRAMGLMLGATVYAFSHHSRGFLAGLALGTAAASALSRNLNPRLALGWCQMLAAAGIAWTAYALADSSAVVADQSATCERSRNSSSSSIWCGRSGAFCRRRCSGARASPSHSPRRSADDGDRSAVTGAIYASNTAGAIVGALAVSLAAIPLLGTQNTERVLIAISAASGLFLLFPLMRSDRVTRLELAAGVATGLIGLFIWQVDRLPGELIAFGRRTASTAGMARILYSAEGHNTSIAISQWSDGAMQFHVAGKVEASTEIYDMRLQRMLAHLPGLMHGNPRSVLVVGFGGGVTAGTFTTYPSMKRIVICELEPLIPPVSTRYFAKENYNVMHDARTQIVYDDARHFVAATREKFDIITSDPIHPFVKGSATLYSKEYFELVKAHLNPGGIVTQWVPLYESDAETVRSEIATFFEVFPYGTVWANNANGQGYDIVLVGQLTPPSFDLGSMEARLASTDYRW